MKNDMGIKIGMVMIIIGVLIIIALTYILIFVGKSTQPKETPSIVPIEFKGPTSAPYVNGPTSPPPKE